MASQFLPTAADSDVGFPSDDAIKIRGLCGCEFLLNYNIVIQRNAMQCMEVPGRMVVISCIAVLVTMNFFCPRSLYKYIL